LTVHPAPTPAVWVANGTGSAINAFSLTAHGQVAPISALGGSLTGLSGPDGLAFDSVGDLYVADAGTPAINEYQAGAYGNTTGCAPSSGRVAPQRPRQARGQDP
jgi:hypothetical protein